MKLRSHTVLADHFVFSQISVNYYHSFFFPSRWQQKQQKLLGLSGFDDMQTATRDRGTQLHAIIENRLNTPVRFTEDTVFKALSLVSGRLGLQSATSDNGEAQLGSGNFPAEGLAALMQSMETVWPRLGKVHMLETHVAHPHLEYAGSLDCVALYKPAKKKKPTDTL
jgi:hypothetical protein